MDQVKFTAMKDGDKKDYDVLTEHEITHTKGTADRLLRALVDLDEGLSGYQISRLGHSLQAATRAERDGANPEKRQAYAGHPYFDDCVRQIFARERYDPSVIQPGTRVPLHT